LRSGLGDLQFQRYAGASVVNSSRAITTAPVAAGVAGPESEAVDVAMALLALLDQGKVDEALARIRADTIEHHAQHPGNWEMTETQLRAHIARRRAMARIRRHRPRACVCRASAAR
jgi:hypothetical protein